MAKSRSKKDQQEELCRRVALGETVSDVCEELGIARSQPWRWAEGDQEFRAAYARARELQAHALAEQAMQIAAGNDALTVAWERGIEAAAEELERSDQKGWRHVVAALENGLIQRNRLRVDTLKWFTSKIAPKLYGDRLELAGHGGGPLQVGVRIVREGRRVTSS